MRCSHLYSAWLATSLVLGSIEGRAGEVGSNSLMKDFYGIWMLGKSFDFTGDRLARAIAATLARRDTAVPFDLPDALTSAFDNDEQKQ